MLYEELAALDDRTRSRVTSLLAADERFVVAARCDDALFDRWATRVVVTTDRVLAVRHVLFEWSVEGARHDWITGVERTDGGTTVRIRREVDAHSFEFPDVDAAEAVVDALAKQGAIATATP